jgi:hypothetical protein
MARAKTTLWANVETGSAQRHRPAAGLTEAQRKIIWRGKVALAETIRECAPDMMEHTALVMAAHSGAFADILCAGATTGAARVLVDVTNRQLEQAGYRLIAVERN